jgi:predicted ester cyclase
MSTEQNKAIASYHYEQSANLEEAFKYIDSNVTFDVAGMPPGYNGWKQAHAMFLTAIPDMKVTFDDQLVDGDTVVTRWTIKGTNDGPLMSMPATGKPVTASGISIDRVANGKVVEHWAQFDMLGMMQQLGATPS